MRYEYARVSTAKQDHAIQVDALKAAGCERTHDASNRPLIWVTSIAAMYAAAVYYDRRQQRQNLTAQVLDRSNHPF